MDVTELRIALFSGNYNNVLDGANKALNRLAEYILRQGAQLRVYSPTVDTPAFSPTGTLVSVPSVPFPGRGEYRFPLGLSEANKRDLEKFAPNILHLSSPDQSAKAALKWGKAKGLPVMASVHTRFETYPRYYKLGFIEPWIEAMLRRFYRQCDALVAPSESMVQTLHQQGMHDDISLWTRGVDRTIFNPSLRDMEWRRAQGIADDELALVFIGRLVMEKGLDIFTETCAMLRTRGIAHQVIVIGDGPARPWFEKNLPEGKFIGFQAGQDLGRAVASGDIFFNPSVTEAFGNVTLEAMACGLPAIAAQATGSSNIVIDGKTGVLVPPGNSAAYADAIAHYCQDGALRTAHGRAGEECSKKYDWDAINQTVLDNYLRLVNAKHG